MSLLKRTFDFLLYSNIFIGVCAVALILTNQITVDSDFHFDANCCFVFFSTIFTYSYLKFRNASGNEAGTPHRNWAGQHLQLSRNITLIALVCTVAFFFELNFSAKLIAVCLAAFTAFYGFVDIPFLKPGRRLRDFALVKTFFVAIVWSVSTVIIPLAETHTDAVMVVFLVLRRFLFIAALTLVFEIHDMAADKQHGLKTFPVLKGVQATKLFSQCMLLLLIIINLVQYFFFDITLVNMLAVNLSLLVSIAAVAALDEASAPCRYYFLIDGMMIIQFLLVWFSTKLFE